MSIACDSLGYAEWTWVFARLVVFQVVLVLNGAPMCTSLCCLHGPPKFSSWRFLSLHCLLLLGLSLNFVVGAGSRQMFDLPAFAALIREAQVNYMLKN